jgi:hypothetical protein
VERNVVRDETRVFARLEQRTSRRIISLNMSGRRIRATFLLRCVTFAACVVLFVAILYLVRSLWLTVGSLAVLAVVWFIGIEWGFLPDWIEHSLTRRAGRSGKPVDSIWFVDLDAEDDKHREEVYDKSRNNPTIR